MPLEIGGVRELGRARRALDGLRENKRNNYVSMGEWRVPGEHSQGDQNPRQSKTS